VSSRRASAIRAATWRTSFPIDRQLTGSLRVGAVVCCGFAALAVVLQAGLLAGMFVNERQGASFQTASVQTDQTMKSGTYALIRFAPEATTADVNKLLENYKIAIVDGPSGGGVYTVRLAVTGMPKEDLARMVKKLQDESVVRFIGPKPAE
jgi:hypothetical protein